MRSQFSSTASFLWLSDPANNCQQNPEVSNATLAKKQLPPKLAAAVAASKIPSQTHVFESQTPTVADGKLRGQRTTSNLEVRNAILLGIGLG